MSNEDKFLISQMSILVKRTTLFLWKLKHYTNNQTVVRYLSHHLKGLLGFSFGLLLADFTLSCLTALEVHAAKSFNISALLRWPRYSVAFEWQNGSPEKRLTWCHPIHIIMSSSALWLFDCFSHGTEMTAWLCLFLLYLHTQGILHIQNSQIYLP